MRSIQTTRSKCPIILVLLATATTVSGADLRERIDVYARDATFMTEHPDPPIVL